MSQHCHRFDKTGHYAMTTILGTMKIHMMKMIMRKMMMMKMIMQMIIIKVDVPLTHSE